MNCHAARVIEYHRDLELTEVPVPKAGHGQVVVKLRVTGVCHTDLHVIGGDWKAKAKLPIIPGHEGVGVVHEIGPGVEDLIVGQRVCTPWLASACTACEHCVTGNENTCLNQQNTGFTVDGSFSEYIVADARFVGRVPDGLEDSQCAPITCAGVTAYAALRKSQLRAGQWVVILGAGGGLGHLAVQYAHYMGLNVLGIDTQDKHAFLEKIGCHRVLDARNYTPHDIVKATSGGAHGCIIFVPDGNCVAQSVQYVRPNGVIVPVALPNGDMKADMFSVVTKAIRIQGSIVGTRQDLLEALNIAAQGKVHCTVAVRPFSQINQVLAELSAGTIQGRVVLEFPK